MSFYRQWLGLIIITVSVAALAVVSWVAIDGATSTSRPEMTRLVFAAVVPLLGTWVGTVLAYNFSRENFETAARATQETYAAGAAGVDIATPVSQLMLPVARIVSAPPVPDEGAARALTLEALHQLMADRNVTRLPVLSSTGAVLFVLHDADLHAYAVRAGLTQPAFGGKTLGDLLSDPAAAAPATSFETVDTTATVGDARARLQAKPDCKDVFVTEGGARTDRMQGWLTNNQLARTT